jgi:hypothetical protein
VTEEVEEIIGEAGGDSDVEEEAAAAAEEDAAATTAVAEEAGPPVEVPFSSELEEAIASATFGYDAPPLSLSPPLHRRTPLGMLARSLFPPPPRQYFVWGGTSLPSFCHLSRASYHAIEGVRRPVAGQDWHWTALCLH